MESSAESSPQSDRPKSRRRAQRAESGARRKPGAATPGASPSAVAGAAPASRTPDELDRFIADISAFQLASKMADQKLSIELFGKGTKLRDLRNGWDGLLYGNFRRARVRLVELKREHMRNKVSYRVMRGRYGAASAPPATPDQQTTKSN